jgi:putative endonuclease
MTLASAKRRRAWRRGRLAESMAAFLLRLKGFRILARGYKVPVGEIDIIARRGRLIAFVEVKARAASITPRAGFLRRILRWRCATCVTI